jgi:hexokinase
MAPVVLCRYSDPNTSVGIIIGTGTNAAYVEKIGSVKKWSAGPDVDPNAHTIINTE